MNRDLPLISPHIKTMFKMIYGNKLQYTCIHWTYGWVAQMVEGNGPTIMLVLSPASAHPL